MKTHIPKKIFIYTTIFALAALLTAGKCVDTDINPANNLNSLIQNVKNSYISLFSDPRTSIEDKINLLEMEGPDGNMIKNAIYEGETYCGIERIAKKGDSPLGLLAKTVNTLEKAGVNIIPLHEYGWTDNKITTLNNSDKTFIGDPIDCYVKLQKGTNILEFYNVALKYLN